MKYIMKYKKESFPNYYSEELKLINNINFTPREIDVMACLVSARGTSKISSFLSIAPKTVVNHIHNLMQKIGCNSREGIIDFIEKSNRQLPLREHYSQLLFDVEFKKSLKKIAKLNHKPLACYLVLLENHENNHSFIKTLQTHLELAGIEVFIALWENENSITPLIEDSKKGQYSIYIMPKDLESIAYPENYSKTDQVDHLIFLFTEKVDFKEILRNYPGAGCIDCTESENYYFLFFKILKSLLPDCNFDLIIEEFKQQYNPPIDSAEVKAPEKDANAQKVIPDYPSKGQFFNKRTGYFLIGCLTIVSSLTIGFSVLQGEGEKKNTATHLSAKQLNSPVRSDLHHNILLNRPEIISEIGKHLHGKGGIETIALVGPGGAGKTTLARQYAHQQKENIIWEINSETQDSLKACFEKLAEALSKTEQDQKILRVLQGIKNPIEKEEKIVQFVKERLKSSPNWFLIFDNVEKFTDIYKYFPQDFKNWGRGKIILTTRDTNIQNNKHVNHVLHIGELNPTQKLHLYMKIISHEDSRTVSPIYLETTKKFLEEIPPYPLDVSIAAYYIKATVIPYERYLKRLNESDKNFVSTQENLIKESGDYTKTRYSIIALSLHHLIKAHKNFADLLLFISLIDSQNIPIDLLEKYKNPSVVDSFIYHLKKFSLIRDDPTSPTRAIPTFSIHRSTQSISLKYLINALALEKNNPAIKHITETLEEYTIEAVENRENQKIKNLLNHCVTFLSHYSVLTEKSRGIIESQLGRLYWYENNPKKAKTLLERALVDLNKFNTQNPSRIAQCLVSLGGVFYGLGDFEKAKNLIEQGFKVYKKHNLQHSPGFAFALKFLGLTVSVLGDYKKAKDLMEQSLSIYKKNYPENHIRVAEVMSVLGYSYYTLGYYKKSKSVLEQSIIIFQKNPENHFKSGDALIVLGLICIKQGNYEKAREILEQSLNSLLRVYPRDHFATMWAVRSLGSAYQGLGNYREAKKLLEESVVVYGKYYGKNHTETSEFILGLAELYLAEGNFEMAETLMKRSLNIFRENKHPLSYAALESLAELYLKKSLLEKNKMAVQESKNFKVQAIDCLKQASEVVKTYFSDDSPHMVRIRSKLSKLEI